MGTEPSAELWEPGWTCPWLLVQCTYRLLSHQTSWTATPAFSKTLHIQPYLPTIWEPSEAAAPSVAFDWCFFGCVYIQAGNAAGKESSEVRNFEDRSCVAVQTHLLCKVVSLNLGRSIHMQQLRIQFSLSEMLMITCLSCRWSRFTVNTALNCSATVDHAASFSRVVKPSVRLHSTTLLTKSTRSSR